MYDELYEIVGLTPMPPGEIDANTGYHTVICKFPNGDTVPKYIPGEKWTMIYWIWRLSGRDKSQFSAVMAEVLIDSLMSP